jgi:catechol 2,3-dioxygenase-like lactoylglutathione lyase family enzyme
MRRLFPLCTINMQTIRFSALQSAAALVFCCIGCAGTKIQNQKAMTMEPRISVITLGVSDLGRSFHFYKDGLGFPTKMTPDGGIVLFATSGTRLFLYPYEKLAKDIGEPSQNDKSRAVFPGFTFGHCTRKKEDVDAILSQAKKAGGTIVKPATTAAWGGYSGYFSDPDGYLWEVAYADQWKFNPDGSVMVEQ